jgi:hypothetical protein
MSTVDKMVELISLWPLVSEARLSDHDDAITWKWTEHGRYTSKSAYAVQLAGSYCEFDSMAIWKAKTEGKHRFLLGCWCNARS